MPEIPSKRLEIYFHSDNRNIASLFPFQNTVECCIQPALTRTELEILDALADAIDPEIQRNFDGKFILWLNSWIYQDIDSVLQEDMRRFLKCDKAEYRDLIAFCRSQDENVFLLFFQLAVRADCPYDQFLLYPVRDLLRAFPEYGERWDEVNLSMQNEKPGMEKRACNEFTIWHTRSILETKYRYTSRLAALFDGRKMLPVTQ
jgi:hypothetical protein